MKVTKVKGHICPECEGFISTEPPPNEVTWYQCGMCEDVYEDKVDAEDCCGG